MDSYMCNAVVVIVIAAGLSAGHAAAAENETAQAPACKTAEVNPVTGHVFCIDPLGAAVEPPPSELKPECEEQSRGQWTWAPNCQPAIEGM